MDSLVTQPTKTHPESAHQYRSHPHLQCSIQVMKDDRQLSFHTLSGLLHQRQTFVAIIYT